MIRRPLRPSYSPNDTSVFLDALRRVRDESLKYSQAQTFGSDARRKCDALHGAIDDLAQELTGDREYFCLKSSAGR